MLCNNEKVKNKGSFVESPRLLLRVIFIAPPTIASNFFW